MRFHIEQLEDRQTNRNYIQRRIVLWSKDKKSLLKINHIQKFYDKMEEEGLMNIHNTTILYQDLTGHTITLKSLGDQIKDFDEDYYNDRVEDTSKFGQGVKATFIVNMAINN